MKTKQRLISIILLTVSVLLLVFGNCMSIKRSSGASELVEELLDQITWVGMFSDNVDSLIRDGKAISRSLSDGKLSGGEAWLDALRLSRIMQGLKDELDEEDVEAIEEINAKLFFFKLIFALAVLAGVFAVAGQYTGKRRWPTGVYIVLLAVLLLIYLFFPQGSVTLSPYLSLAAAVTAGCFGQIAACLNREDLSTAAANLNRAASNLGQGVRDGIKDGVKKFGDIAADMSAARKMSPADPHADYCPKCGCHTDRDACFCEHCGARL